MITKDGLRCDGCGKMLALRLEGELEIYCPRCHHYHKIQASTATCLTSSQECAIDKNVT